MNTLLIGNIPLSFRSADLRYFFNAAVEKSQFEVFHFKHRPQVVKLRSATPPPSAADAQASPSPAPRKSCCLVKLVSAKAVSQLIKEYRNKKWYSRSGDFLNSRCQLSRVKLPSPSASDERPPPVAPAGDESDKPPTPPKPPPFLNRKQRRERAAREAAASLERKVELREYRALPELNPPEGMPRGNVGTPRDELLALMAKLPTSAVRRLGNPFGKPKRADNYSEVAFRYGGDDDIESRYAHVHESDSEPEEWDRHEAAQPLKEVSYERNDRLEADAHLFEDKIELIWDKGDASGLVYYTDAAYWDAKRGGFDEITADGWDATDPEREVPTRVARERRLPSPPHMRYLGRVHTKPPLLVANDSPKPPPGGGKSGGDDSSKRKRGRRDATSSSSGNSVSTCSRDKRARTMVFQRASASSSSNATSSSSSSSSSSQNNVNSRSKRRRIDGDESKSGKSADGSSSSSSTRMVTRGTGGGSGGVGYVEDDGVDDSGFHRFTLTGFGGRHMRRLGWKEGQGIGRNLQGISAALEVDPTQYRQGLGYKSAEQKRAAREAAGGEDTDDEDTGPRVKVSFEEDTGTSESSSVSSKSAASHDDYFTEKQKRKRRKLNAKHRRKAARSSKKRSAAFPWHDDFDAASSVRGLHLERAASSAAGWKKRHAITSGGGSGGGGSEDLTSDERRAFERRKHWMKTAYDEPSSDEEEARDVGDPANPLASFDVLSVGKSEPQISL